VYIWVNMLIIIHIYTTCVQTKVARNIVRQYKKPQNKKRKVNPCLCICVPVWQRCRERETVCFSSKCKLFVGVPYILFLNWRLLQFIIS
jgi:hypothetical protein